MNTNSNPTNASEETVNGNYYKVTTQTLGIATERGRDLTGYVLRPDEISTAGYKFLMSYGIDEKDIYSVKVGSDASTNALRIIAEVSAKALGKKKKNNSWVELDSYEEQDGLIDQKFYQAWQNKVYHGKRKNLRLKSINRRGGEKYISIEFDAMIFIAFIYDIKFTDKMYKISAPPKRWITGKKLNDMSGKEKKEYKKRQQEFSTHSINPCHFAVITFSENGTGFHPNQVDEYYTYEK